MAEGPIVFLLCDIYLQMDDDHFYSTLVPKIVILLTGLFWLLVKKYIYLLKEKHFVQRMNKTYRYSANRTLKCQLLLVINHFSVQLRFVKHFLSNTQIIQNL